MSDLQERFWAALRDPAVQSIRLNRMNNAGRGESEAYQAILYPADTSLKTCFSILRTPDAAIRRMLEQWDEQRRSGPSRDAEDLLA